MLSMRLHAPGRPLVLDETAAPRAGAGEVLIEVIACGVCRTDLHIRDGELAAPRLPLVPGHEIVGRVVACGPGAVRFHIGDRVGVPWLAWTCGHCEACVRGEENLCENARFTGLDRDGGYAQLATADERYCFRIPEAFGDAEAAPLLCAGLIGYRALRLAGEGRRIGLYGFGAAGHLVAQVALYQGREVFAFTRAGDESSQRFAREVGCAWAGASPEPPPRPLDAAILFAPAGELVPLSLAATRPGGCVVCAGIHMSDIPSFPYARLWGERILRSVANLTRRDAEEFLPLAARAGLRPHVHRYPLQEANRALEELRGGAIDGAAVLEMPRDAQDLRPA